VVTHHSSGKNKKKINKANARTVSLDHSLFFYSGKTFSLNGYRLGETERVVRRITEKSQ
jgi:hypothetical protein